MAYVAEHAAASGGVITRAQLKAFSYGGEQLKLIDQSRGIRNPRQLAATLSILSQPDGPHDEIETEARLPPAYERTGAIWRLKHVDLLDAAHITSDAEGGQPVVPNGLSLCKIHHA